MFRVGEEPEASADTVERPRPDADVGSEAGAEPPLWDVDVGSEAALAFCCVRAGLPGEPEASADTVERPRPEVVAAAHHRAPVRSRAQESAAAAARRVMFERARLLQRVILLEIRLCELSNIIFLVTFFMIFFNSLSSIFPLLL